MITQTGTESELIYRQQAIDAFNTSLDELVVGGEENAKTVENYLNRVIETIKCLPSAQLETCEGCKHLGKWENEVEYGYPFPAQPEIIRCKDCKHWMPYEWMFREVWRSKNRADYPEDEIGCNLCDIAMKSNDFCSKAERR